MSLIMLCTCFCTVQVTLFSTQLINKIANSEGRALPKGSFSAIDFDCLILKFGLISVSISKGLPHLIQAYACIHKAHLKGNFHFLGFNPGKFL